MRVCFLVNNLFFFSYTQQDVIINQLLSDVEAAEWRRSQMENSLLDEEQLAAELRDSIRSAHAEIAAINTEKIRLNQSWQSSLLALQKNHDALAAVHQSIRFGSIKNSRKHTSQSNRLTICGRSVVISGTKRRAGKRSTVAGRSAKEKRPNCRPNGPTSNWNSAVSRGKSPIWKRSCSRAKFKRTATTSGTDGFNP